MDAVPHGSLLTGERGRVHWAGAKTAGTWNGYVDGALQDSRRAAAGVFAELA
ncbi:FAD-dependent oxidoreductase [Streptomyces sp. NBC_01092]|uniref:FAD-dependent oxidoreductase n=1 Tax=Streptomyces sp. NBC_01092 TaxID=2903748 RepID=UPI0038706F9F